MDHASINLAANVRRLREERGLTQRQLAELSGVPRPTLAHIESGEANPTLHVLVKVAAALSSPIEGLIGNPRATVRKYSRESLPERTRNGVTVRDLVPDAVPGLAIDRTELPAGTQVRVVSRGPGTRQFITCERGSLDVAVGDECWVLGPGDLIVAGGEAGYRAVNSGRGTAVLFAVAAPAPSL
ncbi:MAG: helix-turn-helix transcriptional regulator [Polyangiaceae bacterium]|nr:helix-turn-helix transcriptional regulator [Polyangiaceae bacterium]